MEQTVSTRKNLCSWLALICGCVSLGCGLYVLYTRYICWSEFHPLAVVLTILFFFSVFAGPIIAILALLSGTMGIIRADKQGDPSGFKKLPRFSVFGAVSGLAYLVVYVLFFL